MQTATALPSPSPAPSALCPAHGRSATGTCRRCGGFFCEACPVVGGTCPACLNRQGSDEPMYFASSSVRFSVLSLVTFQMFTMVWLYRNWKLERQRGEDISPFWRTFFSIFYIHDLIKRMNHHAEQAGVPGVSAGGRTAAYILLCFSGWIPVVGVLTALLAFTPLVGVQKLSNEINARYTPSAPKRTPLTGGNILFLVLPLILVVFSVMAGVAVAIAQAAAQQ